MTNLAFIDMDGVIAKIDARLAVAALARIAYYESIKGTWEEVLETPETIKQQSDDIYWQTVFNPEYVPLDEHIEGVDEALLDIQQMGYKLIILTSRMEWMREATLTWLIQHTVFDSDDLLVMKHPSFQRTPTPNWKAGMLHSIALALGAERVLYIDDEQKNWDMMVQHSGVRNGAYSLCYYPSLKEAAAGLEEDAAQVEREMQESRNNLRGREAYYLIQEEAELITPEVGMRVIVKNRIEILPYFSVEVGVGGIVTRADENTLHIKFDIPIEGAEEWGNEVQYEHDAFGTYIGTDARWVELMSCPQLFSYFFEPNLSLKGTEVSFEYLNTLSGHNQEMAWQKAQEAYAPSDSQIQAEAERLAEQTEDDVLVSRHELASDEQMQAEIQAEAELQAEQAAAEMNYRRNVLHEDDGGMC